MNLSLKNFLFKKGIEAGILPQIRLIKKINYKSNLCLSVCFLKINSIFQDVRRFFMLLSIKTFSATKLYLRAVIKF